LKLNPFYTHFTSLIVLIRNLTQFNHPWVSFKKGVSNWKATHLTHFGGNLNQNQTWILLWQSQIEFMWDLYVLLKGGSKLSSSLKKDLDIPFMHASQYGTCKLIWILVKTMSSQNATLQLIWNCATYGWEPKYKKVCKWVTT
jgi:hypothetical protein